MSPCLTAFLSDAIVKCLNVFTYGFCQLIVVIFFLIFIILHKIIELFILVQCLVNVQKEFNKMYGYF